MTLEQDTSELADARSFQQGLLGWFDRHKRDLPWRRDRDPYRVWLSEIMLQQTRVAAVTDHYERFLRRFPNIEKLASAREASVLAAWSGLGYYRRARMLHAAAKKIVKEQGESFQGVQKIYSRCPGLADIPLRRLPALPLLSRSPWWTETSNAYYSECAEKILQARICGAPPETCSVDNVRVISTRP